MGRKIGNALARFMYGRNGADQLNRALTMLCLVLWLAEVVCGSILHLGLAAKILYSVGCALILIVFFRMFSKNLPKRREENQKWIGWVRRLRAESQGAKARHADKDHRYFTCKSCGAICRVPAGKGKIVITCPRCGAQIQAKT